MRIYLVIVLVLAGLAVATGSARATGDRLRQVYPLPLSELGTIVAQWLHEADYVVQRIPSQSGILELRAENVKQALWHIRLVPKSALVTSLEVLSTSTPERFEILNADINGYLTGFSAKPDTSRQTIPRAVLSNVQWTVCINGHSDRGEIQISGCALGDSGLILCTAHNLKRARRIIVRFNHGREFLAELVKIDPSLDLALLVINADIRSGVDPFKGRNDLVLGEQVFAIGCPLNLSGTLRVGVISGPPRLYNESPLWQVDLKVQPGSSGSPVFDEQGRLVGLVKGRYRGTDSIGFLIPYEAIMSFLSTTVPDE